MLRAHGSTPRSCPPTHHGRTSPVQRHSLMRRRQSTNPASSGTTNEEVRFSGSGSYGSYGQVTGVVPVIVATNNELSYEAHGRPARTNETVSVVNFPTTEPFFSDLGSSESFQRDAAAWDTTDNEGNDTLQYEPQFSDYMMVDDVPRSLNGIGNHSSEQSWSKTLGRPCQLVLYADHNGQVKPTTFLPPMKTCSNCRIQDLTFCPPTSFSNSLRAVRCRISLCSKPM